MATRSCADAAGEHWHAGRAAQRRRAALPRRASYPIRRVVELPRALCGYRCSYGLVLPGRAPRSAHRYRLIWQSEGSPLRVYSAQLRAALEQALQINASSAAPTASAPALRIDLAFLYSEPTATRVLEVLRAARIRRLLVLPARFHRPVAPRPEPSTISSARPCATGARSRTCV